MKGDGSTFSTVAGTLQATTTLRGYINKIERDSETSATPAADRHERRVYFQ